MKTLKFASISLLFALPMFVFAQSKYIPEDDIYVSKGEENPIVKIKTQERAQRPQQSYSGYNQEETSNNNTSNNQSYTDGNQNTVQNNEKGEYLNDFIGSQSDYEYAERIRRFHNPRFLVHISDPAYSNIYFLNSYDWNVYTDGAYAWVTPTWTNRYYYNYMWSPYSYYPSWHNGWYGSSWSYGYNSWCDPWYSPYYSYGYYGGCNSYYGNHYGYGGGYYNGYFTSNYTPRQRNDAGRRPIDDNYSSRGGRTSSGYVSSRSETDNGAARYSGGGRYTSAIPNSSNVNTTTSNSGNGRYTSTPDSRPNSNSQQPNTTYSNNRTSRYTQPVVGGYTAPLPDSRQNRTVESSSSNPTPRTNYYSGSSESNTRATSTYSGGNTQSRGNYYERSTSTPTYSTPSYNSGSSSSGGSTSGGGESRSSGGRR
ncbi:MAG: hypothetical protein ACOYOT_06740 [Bacteroidales bacterium]